MKLAAVRLEAESFADPRFAHLERLLGFPPCRGQLGLIRVALIWSWQTEHYTPEAPCFHVPESVIEMALEVDGPTAIAALVRARLAVEEPEGVRMKGADHERTGWLWRTRQKGRAGAEAKHAKRKRGDSKNGSAPDNSVAGAHHGHTTGEAQGNPLSSLLSVPEDVSLSAGARASEPEVARGTLPAIAPVAADRGRDLFAELAEELHQRHFREAERLKREVPGCATLAIGGGALMGERRQAVIALVSRWSAEARERGDDTAELVRRRMDHLVAVRSAAAIRDGHLRWWNAGTFWRPDSVDRDLAQTVMQAAQRASARGRDGPAARASPRADRGQAPVSKTAQRFDGDVPL